MERPYLRDWIHRQGSIISEIHNKTFACISKSISQFRLSSEIYGKTFNCGAKIQDKAGLLSDIYKVPFACVSLYNHYVSLD
jgi:hypothetical protein